MTYSKFEVESSLNNMFEVVLALVFLTKLFIQSSFSASNYCSRSQFTFQEFVHCLAERTNAFWKLMELCREDKLIFQSCVMIFLHPGQKSCSVSKVFVCLENIILQIAKTLHDNGRVEYLVFGVTPPREKSFKCSWNLQKEDRDPKNEHQNV